MIVYASHFNQLNNVHPHRSLARDELVLSFPASKHPSSSFWSIVNLDQDSPRLTMGFGQFLGFCPCDNTVELVGKASIARFPRSSFGFNLFEQLSIAGNRSVRVLFSGGGSAVDLTYRKGWSSQSYLGLIV